MHILEILLALSLALWLGLGVYWFWNLRGAKVLTAEGRAPALESWPKVSIMVPARNEEPVIAACLESLLALDYPHFEMTTRPTGQE